MKKIIGLGLLLFCAVTVRAADNIKVTIDSLTNLSGGGAMEACGSAVHSGGKKPLLVTIRHDQSYYTTLTAPNGIWCAVVKRWTYDGKIEVAGSELTSGAELKFHAVDASSVQ